MLYREELTAHRFTPHVPPELSYVQSERQWLLISNGAKKIAFLSTYIACQSNSDDAYLQWNEDLFYLLIQESLLLKNQGFVILAMGDFNSHIGKLPGLEGNTPDHNKNSHMFFNFIHQAQLFIITTLPITKGLFTRFMNLDHSVGELSLPNYSELEAGTSWG